jgi:hypothetical protein
VLVCAGWASVLTVAEVIAILDDGADTDAVAVDFGATLVDVGLELGLLGFSLASPLLALAIATTQSSTSSLCSSK